IGIALGILTSVLFWKWIYAKKGPKYGLLLSIGIFTIGIWPLFLVDNFPLLVILTIIPGFGAFHFPMGQMMAKDLIASSQCLLPLKQKSK
ncbi:unnamed protein product, partial [marine sediment metagenome]